MDCPYCGNKAEFITSKEFYGRDYGTNLYVCKPCDARVGTHGKTRKPLGTMANKELRKLRGRCHSLIDPFWKSKKYTRNEVYRRMAKAMGMTKKEAHIGMFREEDCLRLIDFFRKEK